MPAGLGQATKESFCLHILLMDFPENILQASVRNKILDFDETLGLKHFHAGLSARQLLLHSTAAHSGCALGHAYPLLSVHP